MDDDDVAKITPLSVCAREAREVREVNFTVIEISVKNIHHYSSTPDSGMRPFTCPVQVASHAQTPKLEDSELPPNKI